MEKSLVSAESPPSPRLVGAPSPTSRWRGRSRSLSSRALVALLSCAALLGSAAGCDELGGRDDDRFDRWDRFEGRNGRNDGWGRGRRDGRHRGPRDVASDAGAADAGSDAGEGPDAGAVADAATPGASAVDAGAGAGDAGADASVLALSDGQLLLLADTLLAGEVDQARAAQPFLADAGALAYAEQVVLEREAARSTLLALSLALGESPTASAVSDDARAANDAALLDLVGPDAGALDQAYLSSRVAAHTRALELLASMIGAADAEPLRAQLIVLQAIQTQQLEQARATLAAL